MNYLANPKYAKLKIINTTNYGEPVSILLNDKEVVKELNFSQCSHVIPCTIGMNNVKVYLPHTGMLLENKSIELDQDKLIVIGNDMYGRINLFEIDDVSKDFSVQNPMTRIDSMDGNIIKKVVDEFNNVYEIIVNTAGIIIKEVSDKLGNIFISAGDRIKTIVDRVGNIIEVVVNKAGKIIAKVVDDLGDAAIGTVNMIGMMIKRVVNEFGEFIDEVVDEFENVVGWVLNEFGEIVSGVADGLEEIAESIKGNPTTERLNKESMVSINLPNGRKIYIE